MCNRIEVGDVVECTTGAFRDVSVGQMFTVLKRTVTQDDDVVELATCPTPLTTSMMVGACGTFQTKYFRLKYHAQNKTINIGDIVVCVDGVGIDDVKVGDVRKVISISKTNKNLQLEGVIGFYRACRFKLQDPVYARVESTETEVIKPVVEVGDVIECVDNSTKSGFIGKMLVVGGIYTVSRVLDKQGSHIEVEEVKGETFSISRFKRHNPKEVVVVENKVEDYTLVIKGAIVECIDDGMSDGKLKEGQTYTISRVVTKNGRHIELEGLEGETYIMKRFKLVMTNRKFKPIPKVTVRQLEAFRKMVTFNQIIVDEEIYFDEDKQDWFCNKRSDWLNYIRGGWVTFLEFDKLHTEDLYVELNKQISDWVGGK